MNVSFEKNIINTGYPIIKSDREYLFNSQQQYDLNTYATWGETNSPCDITDNIIIDADGNKHIVGADTSKLVGVKSLFNKFSIVFKSDDIRVGNNVPLIDTPDIRKRIKEFSDCSIKNLVRCSRSGILGSATYDYSDFAYCKHLGKIPNNYMVTLRRFPVAVNDYIKPNVSNYENVYPKTSFGDPNNKGSYVPPVSLGCLVTWMGTPGNELENILTYNYNLSYKSLEGGLNDLPLEGDKTPLRSIFAAFDPKYQQAVMDGMAGTEMTPVFGGIMKGIDNAPYTDFLRQRDQSKTYGPIDRVQDTHIRSDEGLKFNHEFTLTFEYELRAYNNINTRQAMLDLLANILAVTYQAGDFFPGAYRAVGAPQSDIFTNMRIFQQNKGASDFADSFMYDVTNLVSKVTDSVKQQGGLMQTLKNLGNAFGGMMIAGILNKWGRPQKQWMNSLLSPAPVGLWHVTVGNPFHPIMSIGNMILENTSITHTGPLGLDDFPTGLKVVCKLKRAKGRDKRDIEKLYMNGMNRIYTQMGAEWEKLYKTAPEYKGADNTTQSSDNMNPENLNGLKGVDITNITNIGQKNKDVLVKHFGTNYNFALNLASGEIAYGSESKKKSESPNL